MKTFLLLLSSLAICNLANAQAGSLDLSFGTNGKSITPIGAGNDYGRAVAIQPDGKIVVGGDTYSGNAVQEDFALLRYNIDGSLDASFGTGGKVVTDMQQHSDAINAIAIQPDGKIIAAGYADNGNNYDFAVARYLANGTLDNSFGTNGKVVKNLGSTDFGLALALLPNGKIVVAGRAYNGQNSDFALMQLNSNGTPDNSFGNAGIVKSDLFGADENANAIAVQADGKIVVVGDKYSNNNSIVAVARFNPDGTLDPSFSLDGKLTTSVGTLSDVAYAVAIQADGKILVAGQSNSATISDFALFRFLADGTADNAFNGNGQLVGNISSGGDYAYSLALQADGKILVGGIASGTSTADFAVVRYRGDGTQDPTFGNNGVALIDFAPGQDACYALALKQEKIVVAGYSNQSSKASFAVARLLAGSIVGTSTLSMQDFMEKIAVAPNPSAGVFQLKWIQQEEGPVVLDLYNEQGARLDSYQLGSIAEGEAYYSLALGEGIPNGLYLIRMRSNGSISPVFLVLQR